MSNWIAEYQAYDDAERKRRLLHRFANTMYPTGWHIFGYKTCLEWSKMGLSALGII